MPYVSITLATALGVTLGVVGGVQAYQAAQYNADAAEAQAEAQKQLMDYNAEMAKREAGYAVDEARYQESLQRKENDRLLSMQRSLYGKSGAMLSEGTPLAVLGDSAANGELMALEVRRQGEIERQKSLMLANNYTYQGQMYQMAGDTEAKISRWSGRNALWGGFMKAGQSLLSAGSQAYGTYGGGGGGGGSSSGGGSSVKYSGQGAGWSLSSF